MSVDHCSISGLFGGRPTGPLIRDPRAVSAGVRGKNTGLAHRSGPYFHSHPEVAGSLACRVPGRDRLGRTAASLPARLPLLPTPSLGHPSLLSLPSTPLSFPSAPRPAPIHATPPAPAHPSRTAAPCGHRTMDILPASGHRSTLCVDCRALWADWYASSRAERLSVPEAWDRAHQLHTVDRTVLSAQCPRSHRLAGFSDGLDATVHAS